MTEGKICTKCKEYKFLYEYDKNQTKPMGVKSACKKCNKPLKQNHYQNKKEKYKKSYQEFIERNPDYQKQYYLEKRGN
jgi:hypothetical protein